MPPDGVMEQLPELKTQLGTPMAELEAASIDSSFSKLYILISNSPTLLMSPRDTFSTSMIQKTVKTNRPYSIFLEKEIVTEGFAERHVVAL